MFGEIANRDRSRLIVAPFRLIQRGREHRPNCWKGGFEWLSVSRPGGSAFPGRSHPGGVDPRIALRPLSPWYIRGFDEVPLHPRGGLCMSSRVRVHPFGWTDRREIPRRDSECLEVNRDNTSEALSFTGSCWASWAGCISPTIRGFFSV